MAERIDVMAGEVSWMAFMRRKASFRAESDVCERMRSGKWKDMERESQKRGAVEVN